MNEKYDVLKTIVNKSWDHGLNFELVGKFENRRELEELLSENDLDIDYAEDLLNESVGYVEIYGESINLIQIENDNELWIVYQDDKVISDLCRGNLFKDKQGNILLGIEDGMYTYTVRYAIDLLTGTIGVIDFDSNNHANYQWKYRLHECDIEMLKTTIEDMFEDSSYENVDVNRLGVKEFLVKK